MKISIAVMAHPKRTFEAIALLSKLKKMPFSQAQVIYDVHNDEWETGVRAWLQQDRHSTYSVVIQDDAIIDQYFYMNLLQSILVVPQHTAISLYTGKVRPYGTKITAAVEKAKKEEASWLAYPYLLWGVGVAMPTEIVPTLIQEVSKHTRLQYDFRLGKYFQTRKQNVYYVQPSIIDHNHELPSLTGHDKPNRPPRVAHGYCGKLHNLNSKVVEIKI